jgi:hypothetical protein
MVQILLGTSIFFSACYRVHRVGHIQFVVHTGRCKLSYSIYSSMPDLPQANMFKLRTFLRRYLYDDRTGGDMRKLAH